MLHDLKRCIREAHIEGYAIISSKSYKNVDSKTKEPSRSEMATAAPPRLGEEVPGCSDTWEDHPFGCRPDFRAAPMG